MKGIVGQLDVVMLDAKNLGNGEAKRPYCVVQFEKNEFVTRESTGPNPTWNHGACFDVSRSDSEFSVSVWDRACAGDGKTEDFLGSCAIRPLRTNDKEQKVWFKLKGRDFKAIKGDIQIQFRYKTKHSKPLGMEDFQLLKVIGRGNFGKVMQVRKKDTGRIYAMKILRKEEILKRDELEHTLSERIVLAINDNPFLVQLKFSFQTPEKLYLVLDYINGGELFTHLQNEGAFPEERAKFYAAELVLAVEHLHKYNIIYRDIKPENVLLDSNGHIALTDFGLVKMNSQDATTFCGTAEYLAPEILKGEKYGKEVDWWSLGILLYEMITGLPPFYSENTNLMYKKILFSELVFPSEVSEVAQDFLRGLLTRNPEARLGSRMDAEELKRHPFFEGVTWEKLSKKMIPAPFKPIVSSETDVQNFDPQFTEEMPVDSLPDHAPLSDSIQEKFKGFTFIKEEEISNVNSFTPMFYSPRSPSFQPA